MAETSSPPARTELIVGVPEASAAGAEIGVGQFVSLLSLEGLTNIGEEGRALPRLAEKWAWENDGLSLRLHLRPDITLHNGTAFTSDVAADLVRTAAARPSNLALYPALSDIAAARPNGEQQLVIDLSRRSGLLPEDLTVPLEVGRQGVGTGPYRVIRRDESELVLERFDRYYLGMPSISRVVMRPIATLRTAWSGLLRGEVDMVSDVPADAVEFIRNDAVRVVSFARWYQFLIVFNSQKWPLDSPIVHRTLNLAVDREALIKNVLQDRGVPATGPLWPQYWAYDASIAAHGFDPALAESLLDGAGFRRGGAAPRPGSTPGARLRLACIIPSGFAVWERIALEVQRNLYNIGVDMQFQVVPVQEFDALIRNGRFDAALIDMISGPTPGRAYIFWQSARRYKGLNVFGYENREAERLFEVLRTETNEGAIRSATRRLQTVFLTPPIT